HLRLAFSVAAHLEPQILLVDEVLAVGDVAFQKKCLGKMDDVASRGRTVLFVSHNLGVIKELCQTSIVLKNGAVDFRGSVVEGLTRYSGNTMEDAFNPSLNGSRWRGVWINGELNGMAANISSRSPLLVESGLDLGNHVYSASLFLIMNDSIGNTVLHERIKSDEVWAKELPFGRYQVRVDLPALWLAPGVYSIYFKLIGHNSAGTEERLFSERAVLDVSGSVNTIGS